MKLKRNSHGKTGKILTIYSIYPEVLWRFRLRLLQLPDNVHKSITTDYKKERTYPTPPVQQLV
jgi:hypothetical protein